MSYDKQKIIEAYNERLREMEEEGIRIREILSLMDGNLIMDPSERYMTPKFQISHEIRHFMERCDYSNGLPTSLQILDDIMKHLNIHAFTATQRRNFQSTIYNMFYKGEIGRTKDPKTNKTMFGPLKFFNANGDLKTEYKHLGKQ